MHWRRIVALAIPAAVLLFSVGFIVGLEIQRGPNWRLELNEYIGQHAPASDTIRVQAVSRARKPWRFRPGMGTSVRTDGITPTFPPQAVRCALLVRGRPSGSGVEGEEVRQVVYLVRHSDALYHVGWLAYEGPEEPFGPELQADLALMGCDLELE